MKRKPLAERIKKLDTSGYNYDYAMELLPSIKRAVGGENGKIYCQVVSVSRSGMSRTISTVFKQISTTLTFY